MPAASASCDTHPSSVLNTHPRVVPATFIKPLSAVAAQSGLDGGMGAHSRMLCCMKTTRSMPSGKPCSCGSCSASSAAAQADSALQLGDRRTMRSGPAALLPRSWAYRAKRLSVAMIPATPGSGVSLSTTRIGEPGWWQRIECSADDKSVASWLPGTCATTTKSDGSLTFASSAHGGE